MSVSGSSPEVDSSPEQPASPSVDPASAGAVDGESQASERPDEATDADVPDPAEAVPEEPAPPVAKTGFQVHLDNFEGPFDLLLQLIGKHKLDVTEVALSRVTDEFISHIRELGENWDLGEATEFLVVAATLLDLKAARLLPAADVEDEEDLALLEARDLLFARLLQYKAYKEVAAHLSMLEKAGQKRYPRAVRMEQRFADMMPEVLLALTPEQLALLAAKALTPRPEPHVSIEHIHSARVSVREHAAIVADRLRRFGSSTFSALCEDCGSTLEVVARFLALLELYRETLVAFDQAEALGELHVSWTGEDSSADTVEIDEYAGTPPPTDAEADEPAGVPAESVEESDLLLLGGAPPVADEDELPEAEPEVAAVVIEDARRDVPGAGAPEADTAVPAVFDREESAPPSPDAAEAERVPAAADTNEGVRPDSEVAEAVIEDPRRDVPDAGPPEAEADAGEPNVLDAEESISEPPSPGTPEPERVPVESAEVKMDQLPDDEDIR